MSKKQYVLFIPMFVQLGVRNILVNVNTLQSSDLRDCLVKKKYTRLHRERKKNGSDIAANENEKPAVNTHT